MKNINNITKSLKSFLKRKISFTKETIILFLIVGNFNFAGYNNATLNSGLDSSEIPGSWVLTNTEADTAKTITGNNNIVLGKEAGGNINGSNNFIYGTNKAGEGTSGINNILMGSEAGKNTSGHNNVSLGGEAGKNTSGDNNLALGTSRVGTGVTGYYNTAIGNQSGQNVGYAGNVAGLESSNTTTGMGRNNIAIGNLAGNGVQGNENVAIGTRVGENVGSQATNNAKGIHNVVVGVDSGNDTQGASNITLGSNAGNNVNGSFNFMVGDGAGNATLGNHNILLGRSSGIIGNITANETISIGTETKATKDNVTAIGYKAQALENKTIALGGNAVADVVNSVAIGDDSNTEGTSNERTKGADNTYTKSTIENKLELSFAGGNEVVGVVSVGNENETRRIQNVAPGLLSANSTDAVNGSQLYALAEKVANLDVTGGVATNNIKLGGDNNSETSSQNLDQENGLKFEIKGAEKDGVKYIETKASGDKIEIDLSEEAKKKLNTEVYFHVKTEDHDQPTGEYATNKGSIESMGGATGNNSIAVGINASAAGSSAIAIGKDSKANDNNALSIGNKAETTRINSVTIGNNSRTDGISSVSIGNNIVSKNHFTVAVGNNSNAEGEASIAIGKNAYAGIDFSVALGENSKTNEGVSVNSARVGELTYSGFAGNKVFSVTSVGNKEEGQYRQIQNVAAGQIDSESTDAINGSQLYATNLALGNLSSSIKQILGGDAKIIPEGDEIGKIKMTNIGGTGKDNIDDAIKASKVDIKSADGSPITVKKDIEEEDGHSIYTLDLNEETKEKISKIEKTGLGSNAGVASAVAMANLPQVSNIAGHRHNIAGAYGYYNGEHAFALGLSGLNETGNLVYKASGSLNTKGHVALGAGLGYQFDKLESRRKDMLTLQRNGNINLLDEKVYEHEIEIENLEKINKELLEKIEKLEKIIQKLEK